MILFDKDIPSNSLVTIIIPTFKRTNELLFNLEHMDSIFKKLNVTIPTLICFDGSSKEHINSIESYCKNSPSPFQLFVNKENLGLEKTELFLVSKVKTKYAMLLGEDDYLNEELLKVYFDYLDKKSDEISCIIPNFYGVDENKKAIRSPKRRIVKDKLYGSPSLSELYKANQMSGLLFECDGVYNSYLKCCPHTVYPHLFFIGFNLLRKKTLEITRHPFMNTYVKTKSFSYTADGLLDEIIRIYLCFDCNDNIKKQAVKKLLLRDIRRYCNPSTWRHPRAFFKRVKKNYENVPKKIKRRIRLLFALSYFLIPWFVFSHFWVRIFKGF